MLRSSHPPPSGISTTGLPRDIEESVWESGRPISESWVPKVAKKKRSLAPARELGLKGTREVLRFERGGKGKPQIRHSPTGLIHDSELCLTYFISTSN